MDKKLFKGTFNYAGESYKMHTQAITEDWAFLNFTSQLAKKIDYKPSYVRGYFNGSKDNYYIEEVREMKKEKLYKVCYSTEKSINIFYNGTVDYAIAKTMVGEIKDSKPWRRIWIVEEIHKTIWEEVKRDESNMSIL